MTEITLSLPEELAKQARSAGLLRSEAIETLLREAIKKQQVDRLFDTMEKLTALTPQLSEDEIEAEIEAARVERRARDADRR